MLAAAGAALLLGCSEPQAVELDGLLPRCDDEQTSHCVEEDGRGLLRVDGLRRKIDFLLVVDDSSSMCHAHHQLVAGLDALYADNDVRFAVVSTDVLTDAAAAGRFRTAPGTYAAGTCEALGGAPDTSDCVDLPDSPWLDAALLTRFDDETGLLDTSELTRALRCRLLVGTSGSEVTMGFEAVRQALTRPDQTAFARPGAWLVVGFATDGNDCSDGSVGTVHGPVVERLTAQGADAVADEVCEAARNIEDSCTWASDDRVSLDLNGAPRLSIEPASGPELVHDGIGQSARQWCTDGDRGSVTALSDELRVACPPEGCENLLVERSAMRDLLIDTWLRANPEVAGEPDAREIAARSIEIVLMTGGFDAGVRGETPETLFGCEGAVAGQGYRYQALAEMFMDYDHLDVWPLCVLGESPSSSPLPNLFPGPIGGWRDLALCLPTPPPTCETDADCASGASCERHFAGNPDFEYGVCSDFAVEVTMQRGDERTVLEPARDYVLELDSQSCRVNVGHGAEVVLRVLPFFDTLEVRYAP